VGERATRVTQATMYRRAGLPQTDTEAICAAREAAGERKETRTSAVIFPLGPYHPVLSEPYALRLRLHDERVAAATEPMSGYSRRGLLDLVAGQPLEDALVVLERACAHAGQAYRLALSIAAERAARITAPRSAQLARVFFAELEMTLSALWTLTELARALNLRSLRAVGLEQRERIYDAAVAATGERVYWGIARPGGVREGIQFAAARELLGWLPAMVETWCVATAPGGALHRAAERVDARQATSTGGAADGADAAKAPAREDARRAAPYDGYRAITLDWSPLDDLPGGAAEVMSCALRLVTHLKLSYDIMHVCAEMLGGGVSGQMGAPLRAGQGSATIQTAHGPARVDVTLANGQTVAQARLATPCAAALAEAPRWLLGRTLAHIPAILVGLDLCPSCADL
jgi:NADH-quinone oxidoreductase subunit D